MEVFKETPVVEREQQLVTQDKTEDLSVTPDNTETVVVKQEDVKEPEKKVEKAQIVSFCVFLPFSFVLAFIRSDLTLLHPGQPNLCRLLAILSAVELMRWFYYTFACKYSQL